MAMRWGTSPRPKEAIMNDNQEVTRWIWYCEDNPDQTWEEWCEQQRALFSN